MNDNHIINHDEFANDFCRAFECVGQSLKSFSEASKNMACSFVSLGLQQLFYIEMKYYTKVETANIFTRWFYKKKYRKAHFARIKYQRAIGEYV